LTPVCEVCIEFGEFETVRNANWPLGP
jgi:hypothetical protein